MRALNRLLAYLAAVVLLLGLGQTAWRVWASLGNVMAPEGPAAAGDLALPVVEPPAEGSKVERIAAWHLFGQPPITPVTAPQPVVEVPKTRLQLTLRGVAAADATGDARAIIAEAGGRERHYRPGEAVPGGAKLAEVHPDRVMLERNGRFETLVLTRQERGAAEPTEAMGRLGPGAMRAARPPMPVEPAAAPLPAATAGPSPEVVEAEPPRK